MKTRIVKIVIICFLALGTQAQKPFKELGLDDKVEYLTLSNGRYIEHVQNDTLRQIGSVVMNTVTKKIEFIILEDELEKIKIARRDKEVSRFMSVDPLASKYPFYSPYAFSGNRVIDCREFEGLEPIDVINQNTNEPYFKPVLRLNLPNDDFVTIYGSVHGGPYAVSRDDRNKINSFTEQGYSFSPMNNFDATSINDNGTTVNIQAGVGGISRQNKDENGIPQYAKEGLFRVNSIQAPSQITQTITKNQPIQSPFLGSIQTGGGNITNRVSDAQIAGGQVGNKANTAINNLIAGVPAGATVSDLNVTVTYNQNMTPQQVIAFQNSVTSAITNPIAVVNFVPTNFTNNTLYSSGNPAVGGGNQVTATQTTSVTKTTQTLVPAP